MKEAGVTVDQWVEMFRVIGLSDEQMSQWHSDFERRHPEAHECFLRWLDLPEARISAIRATAGARA